MKHALGLTLSLLLLSPSSVANADAPQIVDLIVVAGQSNAVGFDAKPSALPPDDVDQQIMFWWRCGDPPPDAHDSTSGGKWTHLQPQSLGKPIRPRAGRQYGNFAQPEGGFGPEIWLARAMYSKQKQPLAVVKVAFSGTSMKRDWNHADVGAGGSCYRSLVVETKTAIEAAKKQHKDLRPRAIVWVQGESDANRNDAESYAKNLGEMLKALRTELGAPKLLALIAVNTRFGNGKNKFMPVIVNQQKRLADSDPLCHYVDTSAATIANGAHFDSKGTLLVGQLFAKTLLDIQAKEDAAQPLTIVTLGDSITKGVRSGVAKQQTFAWLVEQGLHSEERPVRVINVGIGGERTDQALKRIDKVLAHEPDIVTIMYGTNDSYVDKGKTTSRITKEAYTKNLQELVSKLRSHHITSVLMTEPRWSAKARDNGVGENPNLRLEPYVQACRKIAADNELPLVDNYAFWRDAESKGTDIHSWTTDGCHPNPTGHAEIAGEVLAVLRTVLAKTR